MKSKKLFFIILLLIAFVFSSCQEEIEPNFGFVFESNDRTISPYPYNFVLIDPSSLSHEFTKHKNNIDKVEVSRISYLITSTRGDITNAKIDSIKIQVDDIYNHPLTAIDLALKSNIVLANVVDIEQNMQINSAGKNRLIDLIKDPPNFSVLYFSANTSGGFFSYSVKFKVYFRVTYKKEASII
jgi:PBP1b-binding outer membrane lipoprotein LpoB